MKIGTKIICFTDIHFGLRQNDRRHNEECVSFIEWAIEEAEIFEIDSVEWTTVTCNSLCDGAVSINAENATSFSFNNGPFQASNTQGGFCPVVFKP